MLHLSQSVEAVVTATPNALATIHQDRIQTWGEFMRGATRFSAALQTLGVQKGDRVGVLSLNSDRFLEYYFGCWGIGAVVVPLNVRLSAGENAYALNDSETDILFVDETFARDVEAILQRTRRLKAVISLDDGDSPAGVVRFSNFLKEGSQLSDVICDGGDLAGIYYTGGTTGFPKGVMLSHEALWYNGVAGAKHLYMEPGDRYLHSAPMFHLADGVGSLGMTMAGGAHIFIPSFTPDSVLDIIVEHEVTHAALVPTMIRMALEHPSFASERLASLKYILYGASPMPEGLLKDALAAFPGVKFIQGYGQTEMGPVITTLPPKYHAYKGPNAGKARSAGRPICGCAVRIVDEQGNEVPRGMIGEITARSPGAMKGYWKLPEQTRETLIDGWVRTGDVGYIDDDGFIFIVDRVKDMIVTGAENVFSAEVENAISTHPCVSEVAVIGIPNKDWGEAVHAIVVPKSGAKISEADIFNHCRDLIAKYKQPKSVHIRDEPLPLSGAGKVLKRELREPYWKESERRVN